MLGQETSRVRLVVAGLAVGMLASVAGVVAPTVSAEIVPVGEPTLLAGIPADTSYLSSQEGAYDSERDRYLVAMKTHPASYETASILTQLVSVAGKAISGAKTQVYMRQELHMSPWHPSLRDFSVAFNPSTDEYLVVWSQSTGPNSQAANGARWDLVFGQRLSAISGQKVGASFQITAPRGTTAGCSLYEPVVEYNPADGGYLMAMTYGLFNGSGGEPECPGHPAGLPHHLELARLTPAGALAGTPVVVSDSGSNTHDAYTHLTRHPGTGEFLLSYHYSRNGVSGQTTVMRRVSSAGQLVGGPVVVDPELQRFTVLGAPRPDGNWLVLGYVVGGAVKAYVYSPTLARIGARRDVPGPSGVVQLVAVGDGTFLMRDTDHNYLYQLSAAGAVIGTRFSPTFSGLVLVGRIGAPFLYAGRGAQGTPLRNAMAGQLVTFGPGPTVKGGGFVQPGQRRCVEVSGASGDVALANLTPVAAQGPGDGQLVSSDVAKAPVASNVNFGVGTVDPNVAAAPIGANRQICFVNSPHSNVHVIVDHLGSIKASAITLATPSGAPARKVDTRRNLGGGMVKPGGRSCFGVSGSPGDVALVNLTPVAAQGAGDGQLVSSNVKTAPVASNVNFRVGSVDPNVAAAPIGADGKVCYVNSPHSNVHVIADHLGSIKASAITLATPSGAPARRVDTR